MDGANHFQVLWKVYLPLKATQTFTDLPLDFFTPDTVLEPGTWHWFYAVWDADKPAPATAWSATRSFELAADLPTTPLPDRKARYAGVDMAHPRPWLGPERLAAFKAAVAEDPGHCSWSTFFEKSVLPWMDREVMAEPAGYPKPAPRRSGARPISSSRSYGTRSATSPSAEW